MRLKTLIIAIIIALTLGNTVLANENKNLREMFQNNEAIIYSVNLRTFNADDKNGNGLIDFNEGETSGTFINAIDRLDEIKGLGINTLHLLPITPVGKIKALGTAGSLYAMSDFTSLNPQLLDSQSELAPKEQAKLFIRECHKRNLKVIVDLPSCGAYDLFINRPDLFVMGDDGSAFIPADWADVRLFDIQDNEKLLKSDIFTLHKAFIDYMLELGIDGIRADVATIKPYYFWQELISYARTLKPNLMFLAEASESWTQPASDKAYFTDYKKLLEAGFDGYYGNYFELKNWNKMSDLEKAIQGQKKTFAEYEEKKSVIGSFETHDVVSPIITGGENFSKMIIWLNATLPLNPYYVDGFLQADDYIYEYSNKKAPETYTDDEYYYVHQGQIDIFNFSRKPGNESKILEEEQHLAMDLRKNYEQQITNGTFTVLDTNNDCIFAYQRIANKKSVAVIINRNLVKSVDAIVKIKKMRLKSKFDFVKKPTSAKLIKSKVIGRLKPGEIIILTVQ